MSDREKILTRIREALTVAAPVPGAHDHRAVPATEPEAAAHIAEWLPHVGGTSGEQIELFRANSTDLKTDFRLLSSEAEFAGELRKLASDEGWTKVATHRADLNAACDSLGLPVIRTDGGYNVNDLESCDAGITGCDALVAQTGSVLVSSRSAGGRALSVLPPHHVVLARRGQILPDLPAAFALLASRYEGNYPSFISFITGPSRTGDIERILVLGAHGPKKLTILCA